MEETKSGHGPEAKAGKMVRCPDYPVTSVVLMKWLVVFIYWKNKYKGVICTHSSEHGRRFKGGGGPLILRCIGTCILPGKTHTHWHVHQNSFDRWVCIMLESSRVMGNSSTPVVKGSHSGSAWERMRSSRAGMWAYRVRRQARPSHSQQYIRFC